MKQKLSRIRCQLVREDCPELEAYEPIKGPDQVANAAYALLELEPVECFLVFVLNTRHRVVAMYEATRGTLDASIAMPREIFRAALEHPTAAIIVAHNHPSGDPNPSSEDRVVTTRLQEAGQVLGVPLLDHVVVAEEGWCSALHDAHGTWPWS